MAKVGLNFGEKMQIADKTYRILNDGLASFDELFGKWSFRSFEGMEYVRDSETNELTGEVRGAVVGIHSAVQKETLFITLTDMSESEIEALGLKYREEVELKDIVVTYSAVSGNQFKLFASSIGKKSVAQSAPKQEQQEPKKGN